jgi:23S rRNA pseudouridine955/2504/2580 synthase
MGSNYSWVLLKPSTGRTHQLRIHTFNLGTPIIGDRKYSVEDQETSTEMPEVSGKLFLHARSILFNHPETGMPMVINAKLPEHMLKVWRFFGWDFESQDYSLSPFEK